jgi:hypothetical protein
MGNSSSTLDKKGAGTPRRKRNTHKTGVSRKKLRSSLEDKAQAQLEKAGVDYQYEPESFKYTVPSVERSYTPDFKIHTRSGKEIWIECKGRWDFEDQYKHLLLKHQRPNLDLRFVFSRVDTKTRKGSKRTYRDVLEGRGYGIFKGTVWKYGDRGIIPQEWYDE